MKLYGFTKKLPNGFKTGDKIRILRSIKERYPDSVFPIKAVVSAPGGFMLENEIPIDVGDDIWYVPVEYAIKLK